jgi:hypothetical protein
MQRVIEKQAKFVSSFSFIYIAAVCAAIAYKLS